MCACVCVLSALSASPGGICRSPKHISPRASLFEDNKKEKEKEEKEGILCFFVLCLDPKISPMAPSVTPQLIA